MKINNIPPEEIVKKLDFYDLVKNNTDPHGKMCEFILESITQFIDLTESEVQIELLGRDRTWEILCSKYMASKNEKKEEIPKIISFNIYITPPINISFIL